MGQQQEKTEQGGLDRSPAQFFFETGYFAAYAEACAEIGKAPFALSDRIVECAWDVAGEAHDDRAEFDAYLARANGSAAPNTPASNDFVLVPRELTPDMIAAGNFSDGCGNACLTDGEVRDMWSALLAAAPASPEPASNSFNGSGWVYHNEDTGEEYARNHPVESGEVPDAARICRSTEQEDHLWSEWKRASLPASNEAPGRGGVWQPIETAPKDACFIAAIHHGQVGYVVCEAKRVGKGVYGTSEGSCVGWRPGHQFPAYWMPLPAAPAPEKAA